MKNLLAMIAGKKTYLTSIAIFIIAGLMANGVVIPEYVFVVLGAIGLASVRDAVNKLNVK